jgi:hypothetical protein
MNVRYLPSLSFAVILTIGALGVFVVGFAYGYEADPAGPPPPDRPVPEHAGPVADLPPLPGPLIEAHLAFLKTALKVTDMQLPAWNGVADVLREQAKRRDAELTARRTGAPPADLVAALQDRQRLDVEEAGDLSQLLIALKPLYVMLSAEQKETADRLFPPGPPGRLHGRPAGPEGDDPWSQCQPFFRHEVR